MAYNDTVHSTTGMAPSRVVVADVLTIWRRMEARRQRVRFASANTCAIPREDVFYQGRVEQFKYPNI